MERDHNLPNLKNFEKRSSCAYFLPIFAPFSRIMKAQTLLFFFNFVRTPMRTSDEYKQGLKKKGKFDTNCVVKSDKEK